jgi:signal transduction histidine kinase
LHAIVTTFSILNSIVFVALALVALRRFRERRDAAAGWVALAFLALGLLVTAGRFVPVHPHGFLEASAQRLDIELLVLFPYFLYRFATEFVPPGRRLQQVVATLTLGLTIWTFVLRHIPSSGEHRSAFFLAYTFAFLAHWTILSVAVTRRLWSAGNEQPTVAATRMRLLAFASAALTVAIVGVAFAGADSAAGAVTQSLGFAAGIGFLLGLDPPGFMRAYWRRPENTRMQEAIRGLMTLATTRTEIAHRVLGPSAQVVGARGAALYDDEGEQLATFGTMRGDMVRVEQPGATLVAWTSPYAPFFGDDEIRILDTIAALTGLALDRVRLFEHEHESRLRLERANELMTNFVALAAHELRTPVTTVHGFVQTLNHLSDRLSEEQKEELRLALAQQTTRMASLVEQLLDLSRLDADAVTIKPQRIDLRTRLLEVVAVAAGSRIEEVEVDVAAGLEASLDPGILDHIVTNLVTNALRYGTPPVRVSAVGRDDAVRIVVQDAGPGVAAEIEETLFERFTRAGVARDRVAGTGLGLAIARAYARAHRGELHYERGQPTGARFVVELPSA